MREQLLRGSRELNFCKYRNGRHSTNIPENNVLTCSITTRRQGWVCFPTGIYFTWFNSCKKFPWNQLGFQPWCKTRSLLKINKQTKTPTKQTTISRILLHSPLSEKTVSPIIWCSVLVTVKIIVITYFLFSCSIFYAGIMGGKEGTVWCVYFFLIKCNSWCRICKDLILRKGSGWGEGREELWHFTTVR